MSARDRRPHIRLSHQEVEDLLPDYTLGLLSKRRRRRVEAHLERCERCAQTLAEYEKVGGLLAGSLAQEDPPPHLKQRILEAIAQEDEEPADDRARERRGGFRFAMNRGDRGTFVPFPVAAVFILALAFGSGYLGTVVSGQRMNEYEKLVTMSGQVDSSRPQGVLFVDQARKKAQLVAYDLSPLPPEQVYQLWIIVDGERTSGALFTTDGEGRASVHFQSDWLTRRGMHFGVTVEPAGGSPAPTGPRVLASDEA